MEPKFDLGLIEHAVPINDSNVRTGPACVMYNIFTSNFKYIFEYVTKMDLPSLIHMVHRDA